MAYFEMKPGAAIASTDGDKEIFARVRASDCFEPPLDLQVNWNSRAPHPADAKVISYGKDFYEKMGLLRGVLTLGTAGSHLRSVVVLGDRKTGKSTLCNYLGLIMQNLGDVYLLDTDVGQPFQYHPGFICLRKISGNYLTNNTTWSGEALGAQGIILASKFIGDFSTEQYFETFVNKLTELLTMVTQKSLKGTLIVNTSGFIRGTGVFSIQKVIELVSPSAIVEISSSQFESVVRTLETREGAPRRFNMIKSKGDFINSRISVLTIPPLVPSEVRQQYNSMKDQRVAAFLHYYETHCARVSILISSANFYIIESDRRNQVALPRAGLAASEGQYSIASLAITFLGSFGTVELENGSEVPVFFEDFDLDKECVLVRVQPEYQAMIPSSNKRLAKSEYSLIESTAGHSQNQWKVELEEEGELGKRLFWSGPMIGVGAKPLRRKVSNRKL
jgi:hypothetical protein